VLELSARSVDIWLARDVQLHDPRLLADFASMLTPQERAKVERRHFPHDRHQQLITRGLQRTVLSRYMPARAPAEWRFELESRGRPRIAAAQNDAGLHFNLAHARGLVAMAVARFPEVGVDVEEFRERRAPFAVARRYFSGAEVDEMESLPEDARAKRFFQLWTLKEAWLKAVGTGLVVRLDRISFLGLGTRMRFDLADARNSDWHFTQFMPDETHWLALACRPPPDAPPDLRLRELHGRGEVRDLALPADRPAFDAAAQTAHS
jgi:4'-phosphopantetheinyl transferase